MISSLDTSKNILNNIVNISMNEFIDKDKINQTMTNLIDCICKRMHLRIENRSLMTNPTSKYYIKYEKYISDNIHTMKHYKKYKNMMELICHNNIIYKNIINKYQMIYAPKYSNIRTMEKHILNHVIQSYQNKVLIKFIDIVYLRNIIIEYTGVNE